MKAAHDVASTLPVVVTIGFGGARRLLDKGGEGEASHADHRSDRVAFEAELQRMLVRRLGRLPRLLGLSSNHFLCGQSQLAIGADTLFTRACAERGIAQRIVLPEPCDAFLHAHGASGRPDFDTDERECARELLRGDHIVDERVASQSGAREARFRETNIELVQSSDVVICLLRADAVALPGVARQLMDAALRHGKPVWEIRVGHVGARPKCHDAFHHWPRAAPAAGRWQAPALPADLTTPGVPAASSAAPPQRLGLPMATEHYLAALKRSGSDRAKRHQGLFRWLAALVIITHGLATVCAVVAMADHESHLLRRIADDSTWLGLLFSDEAQRLTLLFLAELALVVVGFVCHQALHHWHATREWAMARLVAEVARSVDALAGLATPLRHLFHLPFPATLQPLLRTVDVLHQGSVAAAPVPWQSVRDRYLERRLHGDGGQVAYYASGLRKARFRRGLARVLYYTFAGLAFAATLSEVPSLAHRFWPWLSTHRGWLPVSEFGEHAPTLVGVLTILLPLFAVAALSLAAAFDLDARVHTYAEMLAHLREIEPRIREADDETEFRRLVTDNETRLLGETATWASRRSFTGVA